MTTTSTEETQWLRLPNGRYTPKPTSGARQHTRHRVGGWHPKAKYSDELVAAVRAAYRPYIKGHGIDALAKRFDIPQSTCRDILLYWTRASTKEKK